MKIRIIAMICGILLLISGCHAEQEQIAQVSTNPTTSTESSDLPSTSTPEKQYLRIDLEGETMGEEFANYLSEDTTVTITTDETAPAQMPIYEIKPHSIPDDDCQQMLEDLKTTYATDNWWCEKELLDSNEVYYKLRHNYGDPEREAYETLQWTDEELEEHAWEVFDKIPFLEGEYEYAGITVTDKKWTLATGQVVKSVGVSFLKLVDGVPVTGSDECVIFFDGSGPCEMFIRMYDYEQIGTMDMLPLTDAQARITTPDSFSFKNNYSKIANSLEVDNLKLYLVNQEHRGCTILQPLYNFSGTATLEDGTESRFNAQIIAIPEAYTYEEIE